jgi:hypothetical protein
MPDSDSAEWMLDGRDLLRDGATSELSERSAEGPIARAAAPPADRADDDCQSSASFIAFVVVSKMRGRAAVPSPREDDLPLGRTGGAQHAHRPLASRRGRPVHLAFTP